MDKQGEKTDELITIDTSTGIDINIQKYIGRYIYKFQILR